MPIPLSCKQERFYSESYQLTDNHWASAFDSILFSNILWLCSRGDAHWWEEMTYYCPGWAERTLHVSWESTTNKWPRHNLKIWLLFLFFAFEWLFFLGKKSGGLELYLLVSETQRDNSGSGILASQKSKITYLFPSPQLAPLFHCFSLIFLHQHLHIWCLVLVSQDQKWRK